MKEFLFILIIFLSFTIILCIDNQIEQIEEDEKKIFYMNSNILYIVSKNALSGVYNYDIDSPNLLNVTYGKSDSQNLIPIEFEGHNETMLHMKGYKISIAVPISNDDKYTFLKVENLGQNTNFGITVKVNGESDSTIITITLILYIAVACISFLICYFFKDFWSKCCDYQS